MYKDIISYELADGVSEDHLLKVASEIIENWMTKQAGFIGWDIHSNANDDSAYTDIVYWKSEQDAKNAEKEMINIPNAADWFSCYKEGSINSLNLHQVGAFK